MVNPYGSYLGPTRGMNPMTAPQPLTRGEIIAAGLMDIGMAMQGQPGTHLPQLKYTQQLAMHNAVERERLKQREKREEERIERERITFEQAQRDRYVKQRDAEDLAAVKARIRGGGAPMAGPPPAAMPWLQTEDGFIAPEGVFDAVGGAAPILDPATGQVLGQTPVSTPVPEAEQPSALEAHLRQRIAATENSLAEARRNINVPGIAEMIPDMEASLTDLQQKLDKARTPSLPGTDANRYRGYIYDYQKALSEGRQPTAEETRNHALAQAYYEEPVTITTDDGEVRTLLRKAPTFFGEGRPTPPPPPGRERGPEEIDVPGGQVSITRRKDPEARRQLASIATTLGELDRQIFDDNQVIRPEMGPITGLSGAILSRGGESLGRNLGIPVPEGARALVRNLSYVNLTLAPLILKEGKTISDADRRRLERVISGEIDWTSDPQSIAETYVFMRRVASEQLLGPGEEFHRSGKIVRRRK